MEKKVFAGTSEDLRWRKVTIDPNEPQQISTSKQPKEDVVKKVHDENVALSIKLDNIIDKNSVLTSKNKELQDKLDVALEEAKALKSQLSKAKKEAQDVVKATTPKKKNPVPRKKASGTKVTKSASGVRKKTK